MSHIHKTRLSLIGEWKVLDRHAIFRLGFGLIYFYNYYYKNSDDLFTWWFEMRSLLLSCILALLPQNAFAEVSVIGRYECTVKTTQLVIIEDGVAQKYSGYENGTDVGDKLIFEIKNFGVGNSLIYSLKDTKSSDRNLVLGRISNPAINEKLKSIFERDDPYQSEIRIKEDFMYFSYRRLSLIRYFKTDYSLIWVKLPDEYNQRSQTITADCRANIHAFPAIFDFVNG